MTQENTNNNTNVNTDNQEEVAVNGIWQKVKDVASNGKEKMENKKAEVMAKREAKVSEKKSKKEARQFEKELEEGRIMHQLSESNSEMEALTVLVGTGMAKFLVISLICFLGCFALYLLVESLYIFLIFIVSLVGLFR